MSHIFGIATVLMATLHAGASLFLRPRFDANEVFESLASPGVTILQGVPTMFTRIMAVAPAVGAKPGAYPRLRYLYTGGAPLDPTLKREVETLFGQALHHGYGITEYAGSLFITRMEAPRATARPAISSKAWRSRSPMPKARCFPPASAARSACAARA